MEMSVEDYEEVSELLRDLHGWNWFRISSYHNALIRREFTEFIESQ